MPETCIVLIRHAESTWNAAGRWQGQADPPLSAHGRRQAAALAGELAGEGIERLIASDLERAAQTASILGEALGLAAQLDPRLRELDVGRWTGLTRSEIERLDPDLLARFEAGEADARPGGGESRREIRGRVRAALPSLAAEHPGRRVAVVTHLGAIRALLPGTELANAGWCRMPLSSGRC
ncbi:MAG: histidine phosphatase family protein [Myxococcota bacterium]